MAFSNLFTKLCGVNEDVKDCEPKLCNRNEIKKGKVAHTRKRKIQDEQAGSHTKKQCFQTSAARTFNTVQNKEYKATDYHRLKRTGHDASGGFSSKMAYNHRYKAVCSNGQSYRNTYNANSWEKKNKGKQKQMNAYHNNNHNKSHTFGRGTNEDNKQPRTQFMTQEFKDLNTIEVDGRLICVHFIRGKCIKGDECQLEHVQGYNNLIKEVCRFYVQGFCLKGESCPYMHQSFPCKFFHKTGNCIRDDCRFSHEPLNELTEKLLNEAIKRESELLELNKKSEHQPENAQASKAVEEERVDITIQPVMPNFYNFYNSSDTNDDKEILCQNEPSVNVTKEDPSLHTEDDVQPESSVSLDTQGPVCYSVEAVLGPQLFKPFVYTTPGSRKSPLSAPKTTADSSSNHIEAPYSVYNVLRSKLGNTGRHLYTLPATTEVKDWSTVTRLVDKNHKVSSLGNDLNYPNKLQEKPFKRPPSLYVNAVSGHSEKQCETEALKPAPTGTKKQDLLESVPNPMPMDKTDTSGSISGNLPPLGNIYSSYNSQTPKHQVKEKLHISDSFLKQSSPVFKNKTTASPETSDNNKSINDTNQAASIHQNLPGTKCGRRSQDTHPSHSIQSVAESRQESVLSGNLAAASCETKKNPFQNLFTSLVPDSVQLLTVSNTSADEKATSSAQSLPKNDCAWTIQKPKSSPNQATTESTPKSELCADLAPVYSETSKKHQKSISFSPTPVPKGEIIKGTVEPDQTPAKFHSLFAAPLSESSQTNDLVKIQESNQLNKSQLSNLYRSNQIDSNASSSENKKSEPGSQTVEITNEHRKDTVCSTTSESPTKTSESPSTNQTPHHQAQDLSHKAGPPNSVLRTLFLHLSPYEQQKSHQDHIETSVLPERTEKDKSGRGCITAKQQWKREEKPKPNAKAAALSPHKHSTVKAYVPQPARHASFQTSVPFIANRTPPSPCGPGTMSVPQMRTDNPEPHSQVTNAEPTLKPLGEKKPGNEITAETSLRDLFKSLVPIKQ